mmetsp:Transcript_6325/g.10964  ORF Transcript_6325/g.10964 Transcript_6325/m.10964 type:complete len:172 (-) Transcript_6325:1311-1826(-)|eukprot:CAMPEP_0198200224 /NCGR_PEP_ID=MMETSP1445-20131203/3274_1 /TAXON_ID=36898 /ORGANISM="Pyramimonas sp., Strain CCMP2087" /LENGTH=171 /DNA_ID=CAMNT_0043870217 /DNA_START=220 /DNA_END=735 /DNA_ORIENTATION=-
MTSRILLGLRHSLCNSSSAAYKATDKKLLGVVHARWLNTDNDNGGETEEFIEHYLNKAVKSNSDAPPPVTSRREAISLYRTILRNSRLFVHSDERGVMWRDILRDAARKEFDVGKLETDATMVTKLIIAGRDYTDQAVEKFMAKREQIIKDDEEKVRKGQLPKYRADDPDY